MQRVSRLIARLTPSISLPSSTSRSSFNFINSTNSRFFGASSHAPSTSASADAHGHGHGAHDDHGHGHGHGHGGDPRNESHVFGEHSHHGQPRHLGEWEWTNFAVVTGCVLICAAYLYRADSNPNSWARDEAEARRRRRADGKDVVFGVNYAGIELLKNSGAVTVSEAEELEAGKIIVATGSSLSSNKST